ncbi:MAG: winged helix-turn-helix domain-containing protein [Halobacteria archaeon]
MALKEQDDKNDDHEAYTDNTPLTKIFGNHAEVKIISAFLSEPDTENNVTRIAELAGVARKTVYDHIDSYIEYGIVTQTREVAGSKMYKLNTENAAVESLARFEWEMIDLVSEQGTD